MTINFKRGLLRLWIVFSLCWIVTALLLFLNDTREEIGRLGDYQLFEKSYALSTDLELGILSDEKKDLYRELIKRKLAPEIEFLGFNKLGVEPRSEWDVVYTKPINIKKEDIKKMYIRVQYLDKVKEFSPNSTIQDIWQAYKPELAQKRNSALIRFGTFVLIPPIGLFIFGLATFWIINGFFLKHEDKTPNKSLE